MVNTLDHEFPTINDDSLLLLMRLARIITCGLILGANVPIIIFIMNQGSKTFLDWLIVFDSFLCLSNLRNGILLVDTLQNYHDSIDICTCHVFLSFFSSLCNRLCTLPWYWHLQVHSGSRKFIWVFNKAKKSSRKLHPACNASNFLESDWLGYILQRGL